MNRGFTLIEMLVVVLMVSVMMVVTAPVITKRAAHKDNVVVVEKTSANQQDGVPVGTIVLWYGENLPKGWVECAGQELNEPMYDNLRSATGKEVLPDLNPDMGIETSVKWIIKAF